MTDQLSLLERRLETLSSISPDQSEDLDQYEQELIDTIYRFAENEDEWFNLLLGVSSCLSIASDLPKSHPLSGLSQRLLQHLRIALKLSVQLELGEQTLAQHRFDNVPIAMGLIAEDGRVIAMNQRAKDLITQASDISLHQRTVRFNGRGIQSLFDDGGMKAESIALPVTLENERSGTFHLTPLLSNQTTAEPSSFDLMHSETAYHFSIVPDQDAPLNQQLLRRAYQLTNTESQVLTAMLHDSSVAGVASELGLQPATVRDHLSNIYQKLGVNRKPDLIRKVLMESIVSPPHREAQCLQSEEVRAKNNKATKVKEIDAISASPKYAYLPDGRRLAYRDLRPLWHSQACSKLKKLPRRNILVLHNIMGSCFETPAKGEQYASEHNIRLIVPERPGYGESEPLPKPDFQQWSKDIECLLDELNLEQVYVMGHSLGGAYSMALAEMLPERIIRVALVSPVPRVTDMKSVLKMPVLLRASLQVIRHAPFLLEPMVKMILGNDLERFYRRQLHFVRPQSEGRPGDMELIAQDEFHRYSMKNFQRSLMQGARTWAEEMKHGFSEWNFSLRNRQIQYQLWHGTSDDVVTVEMVENLARDINVTRFHRIKNETHLLFHRHFVDIMGELIS